MLDILTWVAAALAAIVLVQAIWVFVLSLKAHKRWKKAWMKKNRLNSFALLAAPAAFLPVMWTICGVLLVECAILTYALVCFYVCDKTIKTVVPVAPKEKREPVERVVFNAPAEQETVAPTEDDIQALEALKRESISLEEACGAISDDVANRFVAIETSEAASAVENKCIVNIDTISEAFADGDVVNLEALKAKGLVKENADYVKILARGTVDKKLTVEANSFSMDAIKMIILTGGTVVKKA